MSNLQNVQLSVDGQVTGPHSLDEIRARRTAGSLPAEAYVWGEGMADWIPVDDYLGAAPVSMTADDRAPDSALPVAEAAPSAPPDEAADREESFVRQVVDALGYPLRGDGIWLLIVGTPLFVVFTLLGRFSLYLSICGWGYLLLMLQQVIHGTASGERVLPNWPEFEGFRELLIKWFQFAVTVALCVGPGFVLIFRGGALNSPEATRIGVVVLLLGMGFFPIAILAVAMFDSLAALNPIGLVRSILAIPVHYAATLAIMAVLMALQALTYALCQGIPVLGYLLVQFEILWSVLFLSRVLGLLYWVNRHRLGWF